MFSNEDYLFGYPELRTHYHYEPPKKTDEERAQELNTNINNPKAARNKAQWKRELRGKRK